MTAFLAGRHGVVHYDVPPPPSSYLEMVGKQPAPRVDVVILRERRDDPPSMLSEDRR